MVLSISRDKTLFAVIVFYAFSNISLASVTSDMTLGKYIYTQQGEELIDGENPALHGLFLLMVKKQVHLIFHRGMHLLIAVENIK